MEKFEASEKLSRLANFCKEKYDEAGLLQHNWEHIVRNIYRDEMIAAEEEDVDMETLYSATMLHDIGVTVGEYSDHDENSRKLARKKLPELGFDEEKTDKIISVLKEHAGEKEVESIEAKILLDSDKLEKSSLASIGNWFKVNLEWGNSPKEMVEDFSRYRKWRDEGFYTEKAREMNGSGIHERIEFMEDFRESLQEREDFTVGEEDLKADFI
jgi:HD superfamily phosphodiesterase